MFPVPNIPNAPRMELESFRSGANCRSLPPDERRWHARSKLRLYGLRHSALGTALALATMVAFSLLKKARTVRFRWVAAIALWTFLIGPVLGPPPPSGPPPSAKRPLIQQHKN